MQISNAVYLLFLSQLLMLPWGIITYFARSKDKSRLQNLVHTSIFVCFNLLWIINQSVPNIGQTTSISLALLGFITAGYSYRFWHLQLQIDLDKKRTLSFVSLLIFIYVAFTCLQNLSIGKSHILFVSLCVLSLIITIIYVGGFILKIRSLEGDSFLKNAILFSSLIACTVPIVFLAFDSFTLRFIVVNTGFLGITLSNVFSYITITKEETEERKELLALINEQERESEVIYAENEEKTLIIQSLSEELNFLKNRNQNRDVLDNVFDQFDLTPREKEVSFLLLQGKSNQEIANMANPIVSVGTIRSHVHNIYRKTGITGSKKEKVDRFIKKFLPYCQ